MNNLRDGKIYSNIHSLYSYMVYDFNAMFSNGGALELKKYFYNV